MRIKNIYTDRYFQNWPSWDLIYEWEDVFEEQSALKLIDSRKASIVSKFFDRVFLSVARRLHLPENKLIQIVDRCVSKSKSLYFEIYPNNSFQFSTSENTIPVIIDFWKTQDLDAFYKNYQNCKLILISSKEVYSFLKENGCKLNIAHFPLSLSDKYKIDLSSPVNKKYDIILAGRTSPVLISYLKEFEKNNPEVEYLMAKHIDNQLYFESNKSGLIGNFHQRIDYVNLLRMAKVGFYSTPGIDGGEERTGGFNPVTPRLFELAAAGCSIIARYPENEDTHYFNLKTFYPAVNDYSSFEKQLKAALSKDAKEVQKHNKEFLESHYTSNRVLLLKQILNNPT